jgi:asparagine synthase (glutamine-hydrolysing)
MSGIFGLIQRDGSPIDQAALDVMRVHMAQWGPDGIEVCRYADAALGKARTNLLAEDRFEALPRIDAGSGVAFTAAGRVDNREELGRALGISSAERAVLADSEIIARAYGRWGQDCASKIYGDWSFAAWRPSTRTLCLARDHFGNTALFYYSDHRTFAFASSCEALLALNLSPLELDELYLAQLLVGWPAYHGERTIRKQIRRLPPAHMLTVTERSVKSDNYWRLEETPPLLLGSPQDYVEAAREIFDEAVRARLRTVYPIAVTLSGGLDSGSVTAVAAEVLRSDGRRLTAFTSVPIYDTSAYVPRHFGDELPLAEATARFAGNVDVYPVAAADVSPIQGIRRMLPIHLEPAQAAGNLYWLLEILTAAHAHGCRVLLTGQMGNSSISWGGWPLSNADKLHRRSLKERLKRELRLSVHAVGRTLPWRRDRWYRRSAIHPKFAARLDVFGRYRRDPDMLRSSTPLHARLVLTCPGRLMIGSYYHEMGAAHDLEIRDPTADARLLALTFSVPDRIFTHPETGMNRWLVREMMNGRLPDKVRLNRQIGRQAGDVVRRLRDSAVEVERCLNELSRGPAAAYLDITYMREVWRRIQTEDSPEVYVVAQDVLLRGAMAGLFVNQFYGGVPQKTEALAGTRA